MRKNLSRKTVRSMYRSLAKEAYTFWGRDPQTIPTFHIDPVYWEGDIGKFFGEITADKSFREYGVATSIAYTNFDSNDHTKANYIRLNSEYLPYMWEDEVIVALLHEFAHAHVGLDHQHNSVWAAAAAEIGSDPNAAMILRANVAGSIPFVEIDQTHLTPSLGELVCTAKKLFS